MTARRLLNVVETWLVEQEGVDAIDAWLHPEPVDARRERAMAVLAADGEIG